MKINGVELSFDASNPEELTAASRFFDESRAVIADCSGKGFFLSTVTVHKKIAELFDGMYGPGSGAAICGEKPSGVKPINAVREFLEEYFRQLDQMESCYQQVIKLWEKLDSMSETAVKKSREEKRDIREAAPAAPAPGKPLQMNPAPLHPVLDEASKGDLAGQKRV